MPITTASIDAIHLHPADNLAIATRNLAAGQDVAAGPHTVTLTGAVKMGHKIALTPMAPLSDLGRARIARDIGAGAELFRAVVGAARGLDRKALLKLDGDMLTGAAAVAAGLVDAVVASVEEVEAWALARAEGTGMEDEQKPGEGKAGDQAGEHLLEVDVTMEDLAAILGEELQLPRIEPKGKERIVAKKDRYTGIRSTGPESLRHFRRTFKQALKRHIATSTYDPTRPLGAPRPEGEKALA